MNPTAGKSIFFSVKASGSVLGANVNSIQPTFDGQYYHRQPALAQERAGVSLHGHDRHGLSAARTLRRSARAFIGGENDIRGFDFFSISPIAFLPSSASINVLNPDGSQRTQTGDCERRV